MTVHVKAWGPSCDKDANGAIIHQEEQTLQVTLTGLELIQFKNLLNRALNCAPPHLPEWQHWFELDKRLEVFLKKGTGEQNA